ncbi:hypothetical protein OUZ56_022867 [Daphnia magna]|uniref:Uncharacterized protein n=1 Tax=Daphnia magna TaxID=35525 RepID=A0ABR0AXP6_9CRUS|nr:hypothetical protein OUZ56_022867 [Daphnia magna]
MLGQHFILRQPSAMMAEGGCDFCITGYDFVDCIESVTVDLFQRLFPQSSDSQSDTHLQNLERQTFESDILALTTPAAVLLEKGYIAIIISQRWNGGENKVRDNRQFEI